jgi:uncharacterized membrane protein YeaQ/YmgE (transglycosylase-associated protein family)
MSLIGWLIIGALAGWLASLVAGTDAEQGWLMNIVVGVVGALVGGFLYSALTNVDFNAGFNLTTLLVSVVGAIVLLFVYRLIARRA